MEGVILLFTKRSYVNESRFIVPSKTVNNMVTRGEGYKRNREDRIILAKRGIVPLRKKCKICGCYTKGRHKIWCGSEEATKIKAEMVKGISTALS